MLNFFSDKLIDLSDDLIFQLDEDGNFIKVNKLGALNIDYDPAELIGRHIFSVIDEKSYDTASAQISELLAGKHFINFETVLRSRLGNKISYSMTLSLFKEGDENYIGGIARNISAGKRVEEKIKELESLLIEAYRLISIERARWKQDKSVLEELNRLKSEFISNISHELRTPLASIIGFSETILSDPEMSDDMKEEFNTIILTEGKRLARLINEVLELSRMEAGTISLVKDNLNLVDLLQEAVNNNISDINKKNLKFTFEFPEKEIIISGDRDKLLNAFEGLFNNSVKYTPRDGRIKLILQKLNKEAEIILSDTGVGIPEKDLPNIFKKYFSIKTENNYSQTPLGLVFVKQIIDLHKGLIVVHSEINKGTTFVIKLPYQNKPEGST
jgi:PAS domain S-box-containing protein